MCFCSLESQLFYPVQTVLGHNCCTIPSISVTSNGYSSLQCAVVFVVFVYKCTQSILPVVPYFHQSAWDFLFVNYLDFQGV